jgi:hypothetical protein
MSPVGQEVVLVEGAEENVGEEVRWHKVGRADLTDLLKVEAERALSWLGGE